MILKEYIKTLNPDETVSIGVCSGFLFIGKPYEFLLDSPKLDEEWKIKLKRNVKRFDSAVSNMKKDAPSRENYEDDASYNKVIASWTESFNAQEENQRYAQEIYDRFTSFGEREIKEAYRNLDDNGTIILLEGTESGGFWFVQEYKDYRQGKFTLEEGA